MQRPKNQTRRTFLKGLLLAGGGAVLGTAVVRSKKRSETMMAELAELERKGKIRDVEHAKKMKEIEENSKREIEAWKVRVEKERSAEAVLKRKAMESAFKVPKGMTPEQVEIFILKNLDVVVTNSLKGISLKQVEINKKYYGALLKKECKEVGFDYSVAERVLDRESNWNPKAVSSKGAVGLFQVMPDNYVRRKEYRHNPLIPEQNISVGVKILKDNLTLFKGDVRKAVAAYNYGTNAVLRIVRKHGNAWERNSFGMHRYVKKILGK